MKTVSNSEMILLDSIRGKIRELQGGFDERLKALRACQDYLSFEIQGLAQLDSYLIKLYNKEWAEQNPQAMKGLAEVYKEIYAKKK